MLEKLNWDIEGCDEYFIARIDNVSFQINVYIQEGEYDYSLFIEDEDDIIYEEDVFRYENLKTIIEEMVPEVDANLPSKEELRTIAEEI